MNEDTGIVDRDELQKLLPRGCNHIVTDDVIRLINDAEKDTGILQEYIADSILSNIHVLRDIKVSLSSYVNAVKYCMLKRNMTNEKAWSIVFKDKYKRLKEGNKNVSSHVAMYNASKIVTKIDALMLVDIKVLYAPILHKAIKKELSLMDNPDVSAHVQHLAAKTLIETLAPTEDTNVTLRIGQTDEAANAQEKIFNEIRTVAEQQRKMLESGMDISSVQRITISNERSEVIDV